MTSRTPGKQLATLERLRARIEKMDDAMLALLKKRMRLARTIGAEKAAAGMPVLDMAREARGVRRAAARARELGMPAEEVRSLFWNIIALCRSEQIQARRAAGRTVG